MALYDERQAIKQRRAAFVRNTGRRMISSAATSAVTYATCRNQNSETRRIQCLRARFYRCGLFGSLAQGLLVFLDADFKTRADAASSSSSWSILTCAGAILPPSSRLSLSDSKKAFVQISFLSQCTSRPSMQTDSIPPSFRSSSRPSTEAQTYRPTRHQGKGLSAPRHLTIRLHR